MMSHLMVFQWNNAKLTFKDSNFGIGGGGGGNLPPGTVWAHAVGNVTPRPRMVPRDTPKLPQWWKKEVRGLRNCSYWHRFPSFVGGLNGHLALPPQDEGFGPKHMTSWGHDAEQCHWFTDYGNNTKNQKSLNHITSDDFKYWFVWKLFAPNVFRFVYLEYLFFLFW